MSSPFNLSKPFLREQNRINNPPFIAVRVAWDTIAACSPGTGPRGLDGAEEGVEPVGHGVGDEGFGQHVRKGETKTVVGEKIGGAQSLHECATRCQLLLCLPGALVAFVAARAEPVTSHKSRIAFEGDAAIIVRAAGQDIHV